LAITEGCPLYQGAVGTLPAGQALPIAKDRLRLGAIDLARDVKPGAKAITFSVFLDKGPRDLQTFFDDANGNELCGAFYTEVERKQ
jgi:hypothetical protein